MPPMFHGNANSVSKRQKDSFISGKFAWIIIAFPPIVLKHGFGLGYPAGKRRSYEQIKKSGDLDVPSLQPRQARKYNWVDKEKEKERFAHKMATGKELPVQDKALKVKGLRSRSSLSQEDEGKDEQTQIKEMQEARFIECELMQKWAFQCIFETLDFW